MYSYFKCIALSLLFVSSLFATTIEAQGIDELMAICDHKSEAYIDLADQIAALSEILTISSNELDMKGDELNDLAKDLQKAMDQAKNLHGDLENQMDSFEAGCLGMMEEKCVGMEKDFEKFTGRIEPVVELGAEPLILLEEIDNRYDESFLLKQFEKAEKVALEVAEDLMELHDGLVKLAEECQ